MDPHPDFADTDLPAHFALAEFRLTPLAPEVTEEDYAAVMDSAGELTGVFGEWPAGLTLEDNRIDLAWHAREFTSKRSFAWVIRDADGAYLGCYYIYPQIGGLGQAEAIFWVIRHPERDALAARLAGLLAAWCAETLPAGITLTWRSSPELQAAET